MWPRVAAEMANRPEVRKPAFAAGRGAVNEMAPAVLATPGGLVRT